MIISNVGGLSFLLLRTCTWRPLLP